MLQRRSGHLLAITAAIIWSLTSPGLKLLLDGGAHPLALAFWRDCIIAVFCMVGLLIFKPDALKVSRRDLLQLAIAGAISIGIYHALWVWSISLNGAAIAVVLIYLFPTFVSIGSWLLFHEPLRWPQVVALAVSIIGCALLVRIYDPAVFRVSWLGAVVGLLTALTHTVYVLFSQRSVQSRSPWTSLSYTMFFGSLMLLLMLGIGSLWGISQGLAAPFQVFHIGDTWIAWLILAGIALGPTLGGYGIFTAALRHIPGRIASLIVVIEAPISTLLAVWFLGEHLEWPQVLGMVMILSAMMLPTLIERFVPAAQAVEVATS